MATTADIVVTGIFFVIVLAAMLYSLLKPEGKDDPWDHWWIQ